MSRFDPFTRIDVPYRHIGTTPLETTILIPKSLTTTHNASRREHPIMVRWHGGGFIVGHRSYEPWFAQWLLDIALHNEAIIVSPDYRLLPESNGHEILDDVAHLWRWLRDELPEFLKRGELPGVDLQNILCCGESSGGFLSVYCALHLKSMLGRSHTLSPRDLNIVAVISISAPLDATAPEYTVPRPRKLIGRNPPPPRQALAKIRAYVKGIPPGKIRTGCEPTFEMWELLLCIVQQAHLTRLFGAGEENGRSALEGIMQTIAERKGGMIPAWVVHGLDDTMCPAVCSTGFVQKLRDIQPDIAVHLTLCPGEHLWEIDVRDDVDWVRKGVGFLRKFWPKICE